MITSGRNGLKLMARQEENSLEGLAGSQWIMGGKGRDAEGPGLKWMEADPNSFSSLNCLVPPRIKAL